MKVALLHDYLNQYGGAERVLEALLRIFPEADIYTLLYSNDRTDGRFHKNIYKTSFLDFNLIRKYHRPFIPLMPAAAGAMTVLGDYDLVISDSAGYAKGIGIRHSKPGNPFHIAYCHTPLRYAWESENYFQNPAFKTFFKPVFNYLKNWDLKAAQKTDVLIANSKFIAEKIKNYYNRESPVIYPPVDHAKFYYDPKLKPKDYYLAAGRLLGYKKFDLIVKAFAELGLPLKIVGRGPDEKKIQLLIANYQLRNAELIPYVTDDELRRLYSQAKAFIFPQVEDFGLVAAEAQACGTPVIAFAGGGVLEIVIDGVTGIFFQNQRVSDLSSAVRRFERMSARGGSALGRNFNRRKISRLAQRFSFDNFRQGILGLVPGQILQKP